MKGGFTNGGTSALLGPIFVIFRQFLAKIMPKIDKYIPSWVGNASPRKSRIRHCEWGRTPQGASARKLNIKIV